MNIWWYDILRRISWKVTEIMAMKVLTKENCYTFIDYQILIETMRNLWFLWC